MVSRAHLRVAALPAPAPSSPPDRTWIYTLLRQSPYWGTSQLQQWNSHRRVSVDFLWESNSLSCFPPLKMLSPSGQFFIEGFLIFYQLYPMRGRVGCLRGGLERFQPDPGIACESGRRAKKYKKCLDKIVQTPIFGSTFIPRPLGRWGGGPPNSTGAQRKVLHYPAKLLE